MARTPMTEASLMSLSSYLSLFLYICAANETLHTIHPILQATAEARATRHCCTGGAANYAVCRHSYGGAVWRRGPRTPGGSVAG